MFFLVDNIEHKYRSPLIADTRGVLKALPWTGALFAAGLMILIGLPPGGIFVSEFALFRAGFALNHPWLMGAALALLAVVFVSFINHLNKMLYGAPSEDVNRDVPPEHLTWRIALLLILTTLSRIFFTAQRDSFRYSASEKCLNRCLIRATSPRQ